MRLRNIMAGLVMLGMAAVFLPAQEEHKADNTAVNAQDRQTNQPTADQQKENVSDRDLTKNIRRSIVKDKSLSTYAHNVKVISEHGTVTLKGPVRSEEEKRAVEAKAAEIAGQNSVKSEISVAPKGDADRSSK